jgi:hypothetical protein
MIKSIVSLFLVFLDSQKREFVDIIEEASFSIHFTM